MAYEHSAANTNYFYKCCIIAFVLGLNPGAGLVCQNANFFTILSSVSTHYVSPSEARDPEFMAETLCSPQIEG
jgi:hypothetical protein